MKKARILLVDDDAALRGSLAEQLVMAGEFEVAEADCGARGLEMAKAGTFQLILLDVGLPDLDGREVCRSLRRGGVTCPVVMLTAADGDSDTILGLDAGANDYVTKPFKMGVLLARLRTQLRSHAKNEEAVYAIGPYSFRPAAKVLVNGANGRKVRLTEKETSILKYLYRAGDSVVPRDELLREVWGYNAGVTSHTLETHIYRLRQKLEPDPANAVLLRTGPGGYRLTP